MHNAVKVPYLIQNQPSNLGKDKLTNTVNERNLNLANDQTGPKYGECYTELR